MAEHPADADPPPTGPAPRPRAVGRPRTDAQVAAATPENDARAKLAQVQALLSSALGDAKAAPLAPDPPAVETSAPKGGFRFQRAAEADPDELPPTARPKPVARAVRPAAPTPPPTGFAAFSRRPIFVFVVGQLFAFGLIALGVILGEADSKAPARPPGAPGPPESVPLRTSDEIEAAVHKTDLAFAAVNAGDPDGAAKLFAEVAAPPLVLRGAEYQLALLGLRRGDLLNADTHLQQALDAGEQVAACCYLRATIAGANGNYDAVSRQLRTSTEAEPFNARYFFYRGESLRREGKTREAAASIQQALARPGTAEERQLYDFKLRLAQVEAGSAAPFQTVLNDKLQEPAPGGDWLLLAAAGKLLARDDPAAATFLEAAKLVLPPDTYLTWTRDYAFQDHAGEPKMAALLSAPPAPNEAVIDPTVAPPAQADPALWHPNGNPPPSAGR